MLAEELVRWLGFECYWLSHIVLHCMERRDRGRRRDKEYGSFALVLIFFPSSLTLESRKVDLLAFDLPGREMRCNEAPYPSLHAAALDLVRISHHLLRDPQVPFVILAHSMGCWLAYEFVMLLHQRKMEEEAEMKVMGAMQGVGGASETSNHVRWWGNRANTPCPNALELPVQIYVACFPPPWLPVDQRPWTVSSLLDDEGLKEECRQWGTSPAIFEPGVWSLFSTLLRADFHLFDSYIVPRFSTLSRSFQVQGMEETSHTREEKEAEVRTVSTHMQCESITASESYFLPCPVHTTAARRDHRVPPALMKGWSGDQKAPSLEIDGPHLFVYDYKARAVWLEHIIADIQRLGLIE